MEGVGACHLPLTLIALLFLAPLVTAQELPPPIEQAHPRSVRLAQISEAWELAEPEARAAARASSLGWLKRGLPAIYAPPMEDLGGLLHMLRGDETTFLAERKLADSLDLNFEDRAYETPTDPDETWAGPLTLHVIPVHPRPEIGDVELTLYWISPDGDELRARNEPVAANAFRPPGFAMFVQAPVCAPGEQWHLLCEITSERGSARGVPIPVKCLPAAVDGSFLLQRGRLPRGFGAQLFESEDETGRSAYVVDPPQGEVQRTLLVIVPMHEDPGWILSGTRGAAWRKLAREAHCRVVVTNLPLVGASVQNAVGLARHLLTGSGPLIVFTRGQEAARLQAQRGAKFCDAVALSYPLQGREPRSLGNTPTLFLDVLADEDVTETRSVEGAGPLTWVRRREPPLGPQAEIPARLKAWIGNIGD